MYLWIEKGEKTLIEAQDYIHKCLVFSTTQTYSVYCYRGVNTLDNIHISKLENACSLYG